MSRVFHACPKAVLVVGLVHFTVSIQPDIRENRRNQQDFRGCLRKNGL